MIYDDNGKLSTENAMDINFNLWPQTLTDTDMMWTMVTSQLLKLEYKLTFLFQESTVITLADWY